MPQHLAQGGFDVYTQDAIDAYLSERKNAES
jgi:hypothetical protein